MPGLPLRPPTGGIGGNVIIPGGGGGGGGGTVILKEPGSFAAGGGAGRNSLIARGGNKQMPFIRRRKFPDQIGPATQNQGVLNDYPENPYRGIDGFNNYRASFLLGHDRPTAAQQHLASSTNPWAGYPDRDTVQRMSDAITMWGGHSLNPLRWRGGAGLDVGDPTDMLKRLLRERMAGGDTYGG